MAIDDKEESKLKLDRKFLSEQWTEKVPSTNLISINTIIALLRKYRNNKPIVALLLVHDIIVHQVKGVDSLIRTLTTKHILSLVEREKLLNWPSSAEKMDNLLSIIYSTGERKHIEDLINEMKNENNTLIVEMYQQMLQQIDDAVDYQESDLPAAEDKPHYSTIYFMCSKGQIAANLKALIEEQKDIFEEQVFRRNAKITSIGKTSVKIISLNLEIQDQWQAFTLMKSLDTEIPERRIQNWYEVNQCSSPGEMNRQILFGIYTKDRVELISYFNEGINISFSENVETKDMTLYVLLVGQTGSGKSSLGNFILSASPDHIPDKVHFPVGHAQNSVTMNNTKKNMVVSGVNVTIIDTPGVFNTRDEPEKIKEEIETAIRNSHRDYDAIIYVTRIFERHLQMTDEEIESLNLIKQVLGPKFWKYVVMVFTYGKDFERQMQEQERTTGQYYRFEDYLSRHPVSGNKYLLGPYAKEANNGVVLLDNSETNIYKKEEMVRSFLLKVDEVVRRNQGKGYGEKDLPIDFVSEINTEGDRTIKLWELFTLVAFIAVAAAVMLVGR